MISIKKKVDEELVKKNEEEGGEEEKKEEKGKEEELKTPAAKRKGAKGKKGEEVKKNEVCNEEVCKMLIDIFSEVRDGDVLKMNQNIVERLDDFVDGEYLDVVFNKVCEVFKVNCCKNIEDFSASPFLSVSPLSSTFTASPSSSSSFNC